MLIFTMKDTFGRLFELIYTWLTHEYTVLGFYKFSHWDVILFTVICGIVSYVFWEFMKG